jgi:hypothetical protein
VYHQKQKVVENIWNSAGWDKHDSMGAIKDQNESNITSKATENRFLKNPSLFTDAKSTANFSRKMGSRSKARARSAKDRFSDFYTTQLKHFNNKQMFIQQEIGKKEKYIEDLRKQ